MKSRAFAEEISFLKSLLPTPSLSFDIGANVGNKSEAMLAAGARVIAFEPNPLLMSELRAHCSGERNWMMIPAAVGSRPDILTFYARETHGLSSLDIHGVQDWQGPLAGTFSVPVVTLDAAISSFGVPSYCKIDVEGWELEVLNGLSRPLPLLSFEFHLNDRDIPQTLRCLERLATLGEYHINVTPAERPHFLFDSWIPLQHFVVRFPDDLKHRLTGGLLYGNIFARQVH
jgi:FkbM family methyltransferase